MSTDPIIEKLKKLLKLQISAEKIGNIHEAANAASRIQELLIKHNLDISQIDISEGKEKPVEGTIIDADKLYQKNEGEWLWILLTGIAKGYLCTPIINASYKFNGVRTTQVKTHLTIVGKKDNIEIVLFLFDQLSVRIREMAKEAWKTYVGDEKRNTYIRGFLMGCSQAIKIRLAQDIDKMRENKEDSQTSGLILRNDKAIDEWIEQNMGELEMGKMGRAMKGVGGFEDGTEAGENMDIHKGVKGNTFGNKLLN